MSLKLEMLQVARLAPNILGESSPLVITFLDGQRNKKGGFNDRGGESDLYYTVFGIEALIGMQYDISGDALKRYLQQFTEIYSLDLVHLSCLARCWSDLPKTMQCGIPADAIIKCLYTFSTPDGGYHVTKGNTTGNVYGAFLALGIYQDLQVPIPDGERLFNTVVLSQCADGGYANDQNLQVGLTPVTAAAVVIAKQLNMSLPDSVGDWLMARCYIEGGFFAAPMAPMPDLLSTATALHALSCLKRDITPIKEISLDYVDSLWQNKGSFYGNWGDEILDCEYTFYGLLALGHLSL